MKTAGRIVLVTLITALSVGAIYAGITIYSLSNICLFKKDFSIDNIDDKYLYMTVKLWIKNPSSLAVSLTGYYFDIYINSINCANVLNATKQTMAANQINVFTIPVKIEYEKTLGVLFSSQILGYIATKQYNKIQFGMKGGIVGSLFGLTATKKLEFNQSLQDIIKLSSQPSPIC